MQVFEFPAFNVRLTPPLKMRLSGRFMCLIYKIVSLTAASTFRGQTICYIVFFFALNL